MVLGPLLGAGRIGAELAGAEDQYPSLRSVTEWSNFKTATWWTFFVIAGLSFYGGWGLARGTGWQVVKRAQAILWISGPIGSLVMGVVLPIVTFGNANAIDGHVVGGFLASVIAAAVWTAYLSRSRRVRVTFAHCVRGEPSESCGRTETQKTDPRNVQQRTSPSNAATSSRGATTVDVNVEENMWAQALAEYESTARRPGLYAREFARAQGDEAVTKANYLKHRVEEMTLERQQLIRAREQAEREEIERERLARLTKEQLAYELLPKGHCPSCEAVIPLAADECPKCRALFGPESAWKIQPISVDPSVGANAVVARICDSCRAVNSGDRTTCLRCGALFPA